MSRVPPAADCAERMQEANERPLTITYPVDLAYEVEQVAALLHSTSAYLGRLRDWAVAEHTAGRLEFAHLIDDEFAQFLLYMDASRARTTDAGDTLNYSYEAASDMRRGDPADTDPEDKP